MDLTPTETVIATEVAKEVIKPPMRTFRLFWDELLGDFHSYCRKNEFLRELDFQLFQEEVQKNVIEIPEQLMQEPKISVIGPTLEAAKYHLGEEEMRNMFAKLLASSMDMSKSNTVRSSFVEIIKQLEPIDASNLIVFKEDIIQPCATFAVSDPKNHAYNTIMDILFAGNKAHPRIDVHSSSMYNLQRLGLIEINANTSLTDKSKYEIFRSHPLANEIKQKALSGYYGLDKVFYLLEGYYLLTGLGKDFISVCL